MALVLILDVLAKRNVRNRTILKAETGENFFSSQSLSLYVSYRSHTCLAPCIKCSGYVMQGRGNMREKDTNIHCCTGDGGSDYDSSINGK